MNKDAVFLGQNQTVSGTPTEVQLTTSEVLYSVGDVAEAVGVSVTTIKRMSAELRMDLLHTKGGIKLFTTAQVEKLKAEKARRQTEAWR